MKAFRFRSSFAVTTLLALAAFFVPAPARALQVYARAGRAGSNAVANHADSLPNSASVSAGSVAADSADVDNSPIQYPSGVRSAKLLNQIFGGEIPLRKLSRL